MLKTARFTHQAACTHRLLQLWTGRYLPNLSALTAQTDCFPAADVVEAASTQGRATTGSKVRRILQSTCDLAGLEANSLFSYIPNIVSLSEARRLSLSVQQVYEKMLQVYERQQALGYFLKFIDSSADLFSKLATPALMLPAIHKLADELEPVLMQLQREHLRSDNPQTIGFLTTQLHFSTKEILNQLTIYEQILLSPYLTFVEEQVCIPWQRICSAAARHLPGAPIFQLVEAQLAHCQTVAAAVYDRATQEYPEFHSRRGGLNHAGVRASTLRDFNMMQAYLWLCILEGEMKAIEQELLPLCRMVFPSINIQWHFVEGMLHLLLEEVGVRAKPEHLELLKPYTEAMQQCFAYSALR